MRSVYVSVCVCVCDCPTLGRGSAVVNSHFATKATVSKTISCRKGGLFCGSSQLCDGGPEMCLNVFVRVDKILFVM